MLELKIFSSKRLVSVEKSSDSISIVKPWREMAIIPTLLFCGFTGCYIYEYWQTKILITASWKVVAVIDLLLLPWWLITFFGRTQMKLTRLGFNSKDRFIKIFNLSVSSKDIKSFGVEITKEFSREPASNSYYLTLEKTNGEQLRLFKTYQESDVLLAQNALNEFLIQK